MSHSESGPTIDPSAPPPHEALPGAAIDHPRQIGAYTILSVLGEGGMGTVYIAQQRHPVQRRVALKLIKLGMDTREVIARFEAERQALAVMDHPNIAKVFEAGATEQGKPYFIMELVQGLPLTQYCDKARLSTGQRLELFAQICDAVQHAHTKGIIHRDLKPGNIIVSEANDKPVPKIIDFGVAKATNQRLTERTLFTEMGQMVGTPEYMSPEQSESSAAADVDARSDVYSLGVMLYELLIGALPFEVQSLRSQAYVEIQRIIREVDPPRPSARLSSLGDAARELAQKRRESVETLSAALRRELEWIPLKAMRKERANRYRTPSEMADDIRNYLAGRPLIAGPESAAYRARKFLRRNRAAVATAAALLALLLAGAVATTVQAVRATRAERQVRAEKELVEQQRALAQQRFEDVRALSKRLLFELYPDVDKLAGSTGAVRKIVDMSREFLSKLQAEQSSDPKLLRDTALAYAALGDIQGNPNLNNVGDVAGAMQSYEKLRQLAERLAALNANDPEAISLLGTVELKFGDVLGRQGRTQEAQEHFRRAGELYDRAAMLEPDSFIRQHNAMIGPERLAAIQIAAGDIDAALKTFRLRLEKARQITDIFPNERRAADLVPKALMSVGMAQQRAGDYQGADKTYAESLALRQKLAAQDPDDANRQRSLATGYVTLARSRMSQQNDFEGAAEPAKRGVQILRRCFAADPRNTSIRDELAESLMLQGDLLTEANHFEEALKAFDETIALYKESLQITPTDRALRQMLIVAYGQLAALHDRRRDFDASIATRNTGLEQLQALVDAEPENRRLRDGLAYARMHLGHTLHLKGNDEAAAEHARFAVNIFTKSMDEFPSDVRAKENYLESLRFLVESLDGIRLSAQAPADRRDALREEVRGLLERRRQGYLEMRKAGTLPPSKAGVLDELAEALGNLDAEPATAPAK